MPDGYKTGWYIPSYGEMKSIFPEAESCDSPRDSFDKVNAAFTKLSISSYLKDNKGFWSSSQETNADKAYLFNYPCNGVYEYGVSDERFVFVIRDFTPVTP